MENNEIKGGEKPKFQTLEVEDSKYKTLLTPKFEKRIPWQKPDERRVYSYLPGTVLKVLVKKGDKVKAGQLLMQFEAMKMVNSVKAAKSGVLKDVLIKAGDKLPKNVLMFEFE